MTGVAAQLESVGAGFWLFLLLVVLGFGLLVVVWAVIRNMLGPRSQWRRDMALQERIRQEKRRLQVDPWQESGRRLADEGEGDEGDGENPPDGDRQPPDDRPGATDDEARG